MTEEIDESLYSRQLYVLGREAMVRMSRSNVLVVGLRGLGIEVAKNVALAGVKSLAVHDPTPVTVADLSSQFFLRQDDIGSRRDQVSAPRLAELNSYVPVGVVDGIDNESLAQFQVVVVTDGVSPQELLRINEYTHANNIGFVQTQSRGLFGQVFVDLGPSFTVVDPTGEEPLQGIIAEIAADGTVTALDETRHGLEDGDWVKFAEVQGLDKLNDGEPREVKVLGPYTFQLVESIAGFGTYQRGGIFTQVKRPQTLSFQSLAQQQAEPQFLVSDYAKFERPSHLHLGFLALEEFLFETGALPRSRNQADADQVVALAKKLAQKFPKVLPDGELDSKLVTELSFQARGDLSPMAAFLGGLVAQEVLKACSGKFGPIQQYLYFDSLESMPSDYQSLTEDDVRAHGTRYDGTVAVFGHKFVDQLRNLKLFLVGSGAIGCEMLKNWAMLGVGSGPHGKIVVTDNDSIEKSNLNRQFLFRAHDVGHQKSEAAARAVTVMNPDLQGKIKAMNDKVGPETENLFDDAFWQELDAVTNALDNVEARTYVDRRCVFFRKPLLESGTLGTKGNVQVVYPDLTESYSSSQDPPEKSIPLCTLRSFPNKIDHTIAWSKNLFQELFTDNPISVNQYLSQANFVETTLKQGDQKTILENIYSYLVSDRPLTFEQCIVWARLLFEARYNNDIQQLLYNFPKDAVTSNGTPFWGGPKRAPTPLIFDLDDPNHFDFVVSAANLRAFNYGLKGETEDRSVYEKVLSQLEIPPFSPLSNIKIQENDSDPDPNAGLTEDADELARIAQKLPPASTLAGFRLQPVEFEKDDDTNHHIAFITAASNLRALNYEIEPTDRSKTKFIAGRIIPAIATTTALVTGLVCLELAKVVDGPNKTIEDFKNGFINLALPFIGFSEPIASPKVEINGKRFDKIWSRFDIYENLTLQQFLDHLKKEEGLDVTMVSSGTTLLYASFYAPSKVKERLPQKMTDLVESVSKKPLVKGTKTLIFEVVAEDEDGEDVEDVPFVTLHI